MHCLVGASYCSTVDFVVSFFVAGLTNVLVDSAAIPQETKQSVTNKQNVFWMAFIKVQLSWQTENSPRVDQAKVKKLSLYKLNHSLLSLTTLG